MVNGQTSMRHQTTGQDIRFQTYMENLSEPVVIPERKSATFHISRKFKGPTRNYRFDQMEKGDLEITIRYRIGLDDLPNEKRFVFHQANGVLTETGELQRPPFLNDNALIAALEGGKITQDEFEQANSMDERGRFLFLREGKDYLDGHPDIRDRPIIQKLLRNLQERLTR